MSKSKVTIKDIARVTGLSIGTIDRVIHNRGEVSKQSCEKVNNAIKSLDYQLNTTASLLANKKHYRICCLLPYARSGEYWDLIYKGIELAKQDVTNLNVSIDTISYEQFSRKEYNDAIRQLKSNPPQAVIIAPMYHSETLELSHFLKSKNIPLVFIDSKIENADYLAYYGLQMFDSGYLAASLLIGDKKVDEIVNFRIDRGATPIDNPTLDRRNGFVGYVSHHAPNVNIFNVFIKPYDIPHNYSVFDSFFSEHPSVSHIIMLNSRVHLIADYLAQHNIVNKTVVGFDLLEKNTNALQNGFVSYLIVQRTELQVRRGVNALVEFLAFGKNPLQKDNYMPMDILVKENLKYYSEIYKE